MRRTPSTTYLTGVALTVAGTLLTTGIGVGWYWTHLRSRQAAHRIVDQIEQGWNARTGDLASRRPPGTTEATAGNPGQRVDPAVIAVVRIPRFGADWRMPVRRGTGARVLREGLGMYDRSAGPDEPGNVALAGHRTTWGAPLRRLDRLRPGDDILVRTPNRTLRYRVTARGVTSPDDTSIIRSDPPAGTRSLLTLTTCHPELSARRRLFVHAALLEPATS